MQRLFSRDNHNHDQVLGEHTMNLPLLLPENQTKPPFTYVNAATGQINRAPYSTDNVMHQEWHKYRLGTNLTPPRGSDSDIYFDQVPEHPIALRGMDWLDTLAEKPKHQILSIDQRVAQTCQAQPDKQVCSQTCVDWWTNRIVNPQGSLMNTDQISGGCPFGTTRALNCYPCQVHNTYVRGSQ
uniref:Uncharacterized protein n=1 Tax=viral metagenome TaxID=1070528 RepID=A0A6C0BM39_9ZZZZ